MSKSFNQGNFITFAEPGDLANSTGKGSIDTVAFSSEIIVLPLEDMGLGACVGPTYGDGTHGMFVLGNEGKYFRVAEMWLKRPNVPDLSHFTFTATVPGFTAAGTVCRTKDGWWEIVFKAEARCGACAVACGSCARKG